MSAIFHSFFRRDGTRERTLAAEAFFSHVVNASSRELCSFTDDMPLTLT